MRKPEAVVTAILNRFSEGTISEEQLSKQLQGCGWTRRQVHEYMARSDAFDAERQRFQARQPGPAAALPPRDFVAERRAAMERQPAAAEILESWRREEINLGQLLRVLQASGWTRREVYAYLEREAEEDRRQRAELRN